MMMLIPSDNKDINDSSGVDPPKQAPLPDTYCDDPCDEAIPNDNSNLEREKERTNGLP